VTKQQSQFDNGVQTVSPDWQVPSSVKVHCTTRLGGVSESPYDSLNLGLHVNDNEQHVLRNRSIVLDTLQTPSTPLWLNQVHGTDVPFIDQFHDRGEVITADGSFTRNKQLTLCVLTADCLPVVVTNEDGTALAVMHAGWRGLAAGVLHNGLAHFPEEDQLHAWLGPAIGPAAFEVGQDVVDAFVQRNKANIDCFTATSEGKYLADIYALARVELGKRERISISGGDYCTVKDNQLFHSHRRDGVRSGRMATIAWLEGG